MQERERALHLPAWRHAAATQSTRVGEFADEPPSLHSPSKSPRAAQPLPGPHSTFTGECTELCKKPFFAVLFALGFVLLPCRPPAVAAPVSRR